MLILSINNMRNMFAYFTSLSSLTNEFSIEAEYTITFNNNTGIGTMQNQKISYNVATALTKNTFTKSGYEFMGWNTEANGSGISYSDEQSVTNIEDKTLYAQWQLDDINKVAEINGTFYTTLDAAVKAVPKDNTETIVKLHRDVSETITIVKNQNIVFDFQNRTLSNNGNTAIITNNGTMQMYNGTLKSTSTETAAINNNSNAKLTISGGNIYATGRQAIYNSGGTVEITGNAYFNSSSSIRATVQNNSGTMEITGGTIISTEYYGLDNRSSNMTIGIKDGDVDKNLLTIQGKEYGVYSTSTFKFYDGTIKGITAAINNETKIADKEDGYEIAHYEEMIDGIKYKIANLSDIKVVTFDANEGTVEEGKREVEYGDEIGTLPVPTRPGYTFDGWFTSDGETPITSEEIITDDITFYAHWTQIMVAEINGTQYITLQEAIDDVPTDNTQTTIKLICDDAENVTVGNGKNIIFDFQTYTLSNYNNSVSVITNKGTTEIISGTVTSDAEAATIDNRGSLKISGGNIISKGTRSAVYNYGSATVEITGSAYLSSTATGTIAASGLIRATLMNLQSGKAIITGGTIIGINQEAVLNVGQCIIGVKDGNTDETSPVLQGNTYGMNNSGTFEFYDGILKGKTDSIYGEITEMETNSQRVDSTETIGGETYITTHLEIQP